METFINNIIATAVTIIISFLIYFFIKQVINRILASGIKKAKHRKSVTIIKVINNLLKTLIILLAFITILRFWGIDTNALLASLSVAGLVGGLAAQDLLKDLITGATIIFDNKFDVGDDVKINSYEGKVTDVGLQSVTLRAKTGEVCVIANRNILEVINYSRNTPIINIDFKISANNDLEKIDNVIKEICEKINKLPYVNSSAVFKGIQELEDDIVYRISVGAKMGKITELKSESLKIIKDECQSNALETPYNKVEEV